ncbi:MAG TPA: zinc permease [Actinomycetota bacterium]|nr:zinc permease [Actinomycetota bacterium]
MVFGLLASSALVIGGALGSFWTPSSLVTGAMLAFASGTLISALAFELFPEAVRLGGLRASGWGLLAGAATFVVINAWLDSRVNPPQQLAGADAGQGQKVAVAGRGIGLALLAAVTLDGVPENLALGVSLAGEEAVGGGSLALLVAIFASNFPEALVGAVAMRSVGRSAGYAVGLWGATAALLTLAVVVGRRALINAQPSTLAFPLAFAGGAVLASLADTLMPEAFERGRPVSALATAAGFYLSFVLAES